MINESEIRLLSETKVPIKELSGFRKHHRSSGKDAPSVTWIAQLAADDLNQDLEETFAKLRSKFGFRRKELTANDPIENVGEVAAPGFTYEVSVSPIETEPKNTLWRRAISRISDADSVTCPEFEETFGKQFNTLELVLEKPLDVEDIIDEVEDCDDPAVSVHYERDASWCRIEFRGQPQSIHVEADMIRVHSSADISPSKLIETFLLAHSQFFNTDQ